ncbi:HigA family addiction module antitoxin [Pseudoduganella violacea]|uniref:Addiction module HigA family antidote n=1 Tax=Pseudoduganella violacea TaxID=1715466 RepID=A0A7W5B8Y1_9BURK|nr:HigA family addiction module antitoxin [Pseudoduganella violacea]MBB3118704.1 addiction module HigA family antidote [Pseudoduganella violacea]
MDESLEEIHPGEILFEEFMRPLAMSAQQLGDSLGLPAPTIEAFIQGQASVSEDLAQSLGAYFETSPAFWLNLQAEYDRRVAASNTAARA